MSVEIREIVKAAFKTNFGHRPIRFSKQFAGMSYTNFDQKSGKSLFYPGLKITTESVWGQMGHPRNLHQAYLPSEIV